MKIVVVGFRVKKENSVFYQKAVIPIDLNPVEIREVMGRMLYAAWDSDAEFVSVRFI